MLAASNQSKLLFGGSEDALPVQMSSLLAVVGGEAGEVPRMGDRAGGGNRDTVSQ